MENIMLLLVSINYQKDLIQGRKERKMIFEVKVKVKNKIITVPVSAFSLEEAKWMMGSAGLKVISVVPKQKQ